MLNHESPTKFYIATKSPPADEHSRVLKYGKLFAVFNSVGDVELGGLGEEGIYFEDTRFLSQLTLLVGGRRPLLLSSTVRDDNSLFTADLTNVDITQGSEVLIPRGTLHLTRSKALWQGACYEHLTISSYALTSISISVAIQFEADFADLFEVRGSRRARRGENREPRVKRDLIDLSYRGLDDVVRHTCIICSPAPERISSQGCEFSVVLEPKQQTSLEIVVSCSCGEDLEKPDSFANAMAANASEMRSSATREACFVHSSNEQLNNWLRRSDADIQMMTAGNPETNFPYAGVPWFSTVFGRDGIITALECLWINPTIARGVLQYLAFTQAKDVIPNSEAEPGKILHEVRGGEMAALGEIPFGRYYGSVDSTPLFIMLAGAYYERSGDLDLIKSIWPNIEAALSWIENYGDIDHDGFVEYSRRSHSGLVQQGWKDSNDSVFHADGHIPEPPIALCEVQGYIYSAKQRASQLARALGMESRAEALNKEAEDLKVRFEKSFWSSGLEMYALALDGNKDPCLVRTSNAGQCLFSGIANPQHAEKIARSLFSSDFFSGWGIRTVATSEVRYNPVSYHNGSIWPHDNALIAAGVARYGFRELAARCLLSFLDMSAEVDLHRLPELMCGLERRSGEGPTLYPVACAPQAWAAGSVFMFLEACLGMSIQVPGSRLTVERPCLPPSIPQLWIRQLQIGKASVDLYFERTASGTQTEVIQKQGDLEVHVS